MSHTPSSEFDQVAQFGANETRRFSGNALKRDVRGQGYIFGVNLQNRGAASTVGPLYQDPPVETAWSQ
jgi:hypothetical protein